MGDTDCTTGRHVDSEVEIPRLEHSSNGGISLIVHGKPFLMLAAELQNSSFSSREFMSPIWPELKACYINTVLAPVTWEVIEPREGVFDFTELDHAVADARAHEMKLILLWFGAFKNARSTYAPRWVKSDSSRFPRAELLDAMGTPQLTDALSIFHPALVKADAAAFRALMKHVREIDQAHSTILMVQVENEVGLLGDSRDCCAEANRLFNDSVPSQLLNNLRDQRHLLHPRLQKRLHSADSMRSWKNTAFWSEVFGDNASTDELFMAYHFARYVDDVAAAGKELNPLPLFTNVWQNYSDEDAEHTSPTIAGGGDQPGGYPSGGAVIDVLDIWQSFAPSLDLIAPDLYLNDYDAVCTNYRHRGQPLLIPEQRRDEYGARRVWRAYGTYGALLASPFGIDSLTREDNSWMKHYRILEQASEYVLMAQKNPGISIGFFFDDFNSDSPTTSDEVFQRIFGHWSLTITRSFVFGRPGPGFGMVIQIAPSRFVLLGEGFQVRFQSTREAAKFSGILSFVEKVWDEKAGCLVDGRRLNGDETRSGEAAVMPNAEIDYGDFPICITVPARTGVAVCEVYALF